MGWFGTRPTNEAYQAAKARQQAHAANDDQRNKAVHGARTAHVDIHSSAGAVAGLRGKAQFMQHDSDGLVIVYKLTPKGRVKAKVTEREAKKIHAANKKEIERQQKAERAAKKAAAAAKRTGRR